MVTYSFALAIMQVDGLLGNLHLYPNFSHWVTVVKIIWKRLHLCWKLSHLVALCAYHRFQLAEWCMTVDCREVSRIGLLPPSRWHSTRIAPMSKCCPSVLKASGKMLPKTPIFFLSDGSGSSITSKNFEIDLRLLLMVQRRLCRGHWLTTCELLAFDTHPEHVSTVSGFLLNISTVSYLYTDTMCIIILIVWTKNDRVEKWMEWLGRN